jgi:DNA mismatch repair protein MLH1
VDAVYAKYLPKGTFSFSYLDVLIKPEDLDVNVHPTKKTVHFLNEEKIVEVICEALDSRLKRADESRTFFIQTKIPTPIQTQKKTPGLLMKTPAHLAVRTDSRARTLETVLSQTHSPHIKRSKVDPERSIILPDPKPITPTRVLSDQSLNRTDQATRVPTNEVKQSSILQFVQIEHPVDRGDSTQPCIVAEHEAPMCTDKESVPQVSTLNETQSLRDWNDVQLISIRELRQELLDNEHHGLTDVLKNHSFVGCYNEELALIQYQTELMMVHFYEVSAAFFYQAVLFGFSNFGTIPLQPIKIFDLILIGIDSSGAWNESMLPKEEIAMAISDLLEDKKFMLAEYFSILITDGSVTGIPAIINGYVPDLNRIALFLLGLGNHVDWTSEKACFHDIAKELSEFYAIKIKSDAMQQQLEHLFFPALRSVIGQQEWIDKEYLKKVANLSDLYKIFERC